MVGYATERFTYRFFPSGDNRAPAPIPTIDFTEEIQYEGASFLGELTTTLDLNFGGKKKPVCKVHLVHSALFSMKGDEDAETRARFERLLRYNGLSAQISIIRGQLSGLLACIGLSPTYTMPMINVNRLVASHTEE